MPVLTVQLAALLAGDTARRRVTAVPSWAQAPDREGQGQLVNGRTWIGQPTSVASDEHGTAFLTLPASDSIGGALYTISVRGGPTWYGLTMPPQDVTFSRDLLGGSHPDPGPPTERERIDARITALVAGWARGVGLIPTGALAARAVTLAKMARGTAGKIIGYDAQGNPTELDAPSSELADGSVTTPKLAARAVTLAKMARGTAGKIIGYDAQGNPTEMDAPASQLADGSVTTAKLAAQAVTNAKLAFESVGPRQIQGNAVRSGHIADNSITDADIGNNQIGTRHIRAGNITRALLDAGSVSATELIDRAVTLAKMATGTAGKYLGYDAEGNPAELDAPSGQGIADGAVTTAKLADGAVTSAKVADDAVGTDKLTAAARALIAKITPNEQNIAALMREAMTEAATRRDADNALGVRIDGNDAVLNNLAVFGQYELNPGGIPGSDAPDFIALTLSTKRTPKIISNLRVNLGGVIVADLTRNANPTPPATDPLAEFNQADNTYSLSGGVVNLTFASEADKRTFKNAVAGTSQRRPQFIHASITYTFTDGTSQTDRCHFGVNNNAFEPVPDTTARQSAATAQRTADSKLTQAQVDARIVAGVPAWARAAAAPTAPISSSTAGNGQTRITAIWRGTQAQYDALASKQAATLYVVAG